MVAVLIIVALMLAGILLTLINIDLRLRAMLKFFAALGPREARRFDLELENHERLEGMSQRDIARFQDEGRSL